MRDVRRSPNGQQTENVRIDIIVEGVTSGKTWTCGLEFDYANDESFYCRPLRLPGSKDVERMAIPPEAGEVEIAFLPPMSGLAATETRLDQGAVNVRVGEGRTAEVLRNLCFQIYQGQKPSWEKLTSDVRDLFGVNLDAPSYVQERGEIAMSYKEHGVTLDLSSSGRGLQQTMLILAYMYANPGAVLLLDEPDAHLEILRQRQTYNLITRAASNSDSQIIAASHSEVILNEAADRDMVVAFVGRPHRIDGRGSQVLKALRDIGFEDYYQAEQTGWVLYLEGSTDLAVLQAFARRLDHGRATAVLERPFVHYVGNSSSAAQNHYHGLREALPDLKGVVLLDRSEAGPSEVGQVLRLEWRRREIENYMCSQATLEAYARGRSDVPVTLFSSIEMDTRLDAMRKSIAEVGEAMQTLEKESPWSADSKVSDEFLTPLFSAYFRKLSLPNLMNKKDFYELAEYVPDNEIDPEIREKLDAIVQVAESVTPRE